MLTSHRLRDASRACGYNVSGVRAAAGGCTCRTSALARLAQRLETNAGKLKKGVLIYALAEAGRARGGSFVAARGFRWSAERGTMPMPYVFLASTGFCASTGMKSPVAVLLMTTRMERLKLGRGFAKLDAKLYVPKSGPPRDGAWTQ